MLADTSEPVPDARHPHQALDELFAAVAALWALTDDADTAHVSPPPLWPRTLHAAVHDPLGRIDAPAALALPVDDVLERCGAALRTGMRQLEARAAAILVARFSDLPTIEHIYQHAVLVTVLRDYIGAWRTAHPESLRSVIELFQKVASSQAARTHNACAAAHHMVRETIDELGTLMTAATDDSLVILCANCLISIGDIHVVPLSRSESVHRWLASESATTKHLHLNVALTNRIYSVSQARYGPYTQDDLRRMGGLLGNPEIRTAACTVLSDITDNRAACAPALHLCPVMAALIREGDETVLRPALRMLGNFACCDSSATEAVVQCGFFSLVPELLRRHDPLTSKETLWCLSNILADRSVYTRAALDAGLMPLVVAQARAANVEVAKEAVWCITNACTCTAGITSLRHGLVAAGCFQVLYELVTAPSPSRALVDVALENMLALLEEEESRAAALAAVDRAALVSALATLDTTSDLAAAVVPAILEILGSNERP
jgi:hypothetical protein